MTPKQRLNAFFVNERDRLAVEYDLQAATERLTSYEDETLSIETDFVCGHVYRLLEKFGTRRPLSFEKDCPSLVYLQKQGVHKRYYDDIKRSYFIELEVSQHETFSASLRRKMAQHKIIDALGMAELVKQYYFRACSDASLDIEERYPALDQSFLYQKANDNNVEQGAAYDCGAVTDVKAEAIDSHTSAEPDKPLGRENLGSEPAVEGQNGVSRMAQDCDLDPKEQRIAETSNIDVESNISFDEPLRNEIRPSAAASAIVSVPSVKDASSSRQRTLGLTEFEAECDKLITNMGDEWEKSTASDVKALVRMFVSVLKEHNVTHSGEIEQFHIGMLRQHFNDIPTHWGKSPRLKSLSAPQLRLEGEKLRKEAAVSGKSAHVGLSAGTIRKHFANLQHFLKHLKGHGYAVPKWSFDGLRPRKPKLGSIRQQQFKPAPEDIAPIFKSPIYLGSRDYQRGRKLDGLKIYHDALYFLPIMFTYLGARRKEFAGLCVDDIVESGDGHVIIIRSNELRRLKTAQSERRLPLPDELIRLGFLDYHAAIKARGYRALFPDLFSHKTDNDPGDRFYDLFTPIMKGALGENMWNRSLHALRHGMADTLKQAGVSSEVIDDLAGRTSSRSETNTRYTNAANIALMRDALANYPIITAGIKPRPLNLLRWVEDKKPAPWAKDGRKG